MESKASIKARRIHKTDTVAARKYFLSLRVRKETERAKMTAAFAMNVRALQKQSVAMTAKNRHAAARQLKRSSIVEYCTGLATVITIDAMKPQLIRVVEELRTLVRDALPQPPPSLNMGLSLGGRGSHENFEHAAKRKQ